MTIFGMRGGGHGGHDMGSHSTPSTGDRLADPERERARHDAEIARTRFEEAKPAAIADQPRSRVR